MTTTSRPATPDDAPAVRRGGPPAAGRGGPRARLVALFVVYLALLAWIVLWKLEVPWVGAAGMRSVKLVPFVATADAGASPSVEVVVNVLLFVPFGLHLRLLAPGWPWWKVAGVVAAASLSLEVAQYALAVGSTDVTDIVVNTAGGVAGTALFTLAHHRLRARTSTVLARVCTAATVAALIASVLVVASPLHYGPPGGPRPDYLVPRHPQGTRPPLDAPGR